MNEWKVKKVVVSQNDRFLVITVIEKVKQEKLNELRKFGVLQVSYFDKDTDMGIYEFQVAPNFLLPDIINFIENEWLNEN